MTDIQLIPGTTEHHESTYYLDQDYDPFDPTFQHYSGNIFDSIPRGYISLTQFIEKTRNPPSATKNLLFDIRTETDKARRDQLKTQLPAFTPSVFVRPEHSRKYENIDHFTGLALLDFDGAPHPKEFKQYLFDTYPFIFASWLSSSGKGVRAIVKIPRIHSVTEFKLHYNAIEQTMGDYKGFDPAPKNAILPLFFSHDPSILYREQPTTFTDTYTPPEPATPEYIPPVTDTPDKYHNWALSNIEKSINSIQSNGHPQLRAVAYAAGGYVGAGYISETEAIDLIHQLIETGYLKGKASSYKRTAKEMVQKGQSEPLTF